MNIREDIVFNKLTGEIVGFIDFGEDSMDRHFSALKKDCTMQKNQPLDERIMVTHTTGIIQHCWTWCLINFEFF